MKLWLRLFEKKLFINTGKTKFFIENSRINDTLLLNFKDLERKTICIDTEKLSDYALTSDAGIVFNNILKKIPSFSQTSATKDISIIKADNNCTKKEFLDKLKKSSDNIVRIMFPSDEGIVTSCGNNDDMYLLANKKFGKYENKENDVAIIASGSIIDTKPSYNGCIDYNIISDSNVMVKKGKLFRKIDLFGEPFDISEIKTDDSEAIHIELSKLDDFFVSMKDYIKEHGFFEYRQIPFKIASFKYYDHDGSEKSVSAAGDDPGEVYVRTIKNGFSDLLDNYNSSPDTRSVMAQTKLDVLIMGVLPIIFSKLSEKKDAPLQKKEICISDYDMLASKLIFKVDKEINKDDLKVEIICINGTNLKKGLLKYRSCSMAVCYGIDEKQMVNSLFVNFYASFVQNQMKNNEICEIGNDFNVHGEEEKIISDSITADINKAMTYIPDHKLNIYSWKYDDFIRSAKMHCFKVTMKKG